MSIDEKTILSLIDFRDDPGVLSFYVGITPQDAAESAATWRIEIRKQIRDLRQRVRDEQPHDVWRAVHDRLDGLEPDLDRLLDPRQHGRGRALFVAVSDGRTEQIALQVPFRQRVVFQDSAYVRPLLAARDEGRPAGIAVAHRGGVRLLEWQLGEVRELDTVEFDIDEERVSRQGRGASPSTPATPAGLVDKERFEQRLDEHRRRQLRDLARGVARQRSRRGWDRVVVAGEAHLRQALHDDLAGADGMELLVADADWAETPPAEVAKQVWPVLRSLHQDRERALVEAARDRALSGGAGALGLHDAVSCLNEGRVAHLLVAADVAFAGYRSPQDGLVFADADSPEAAATEVVAEPNLVERMIERALTTGAEVTPIEDDVAEGLDDHDGVAALLRW